MKLANALLFLLLVMGINGAYGADMEQNSWIIPSGSLIQQQDGSWTWEKAAKDCESHMDECKKMLESLMEKLNECQAGRRKEFEAYQRILRDNGLLPPREGKEEEWHYSLSLCLCFILLV